ncbi:MAG: alanine racemase [Methylococcales bacterium]
MTPPTYAVLNLDALQHNLAVVRQYAPKAKIMAVIKANAYGHGLLRVADKLPNVDAFAVARVDEAVRLRFAGVTQRIAVLEGFACVEELALLLQHDIDAVIHCPEQLAILNAQSGVETLSVWLKQDSGMNRLGFKTPEEIVAAYQQLMACKVVRKPLNLMTHLASADNRADATTQQQISLFNNTISQLRGERSIANSAGILGWTEALTDWVRPGIMLYGVSPFAEQTGAQFGLKPVMSLHSHLIAVKDLAKGETIGYSGRWRCEKPTRYGVVAIGYGDGYPRYAKTGTPVLVNGQRVPLIGRVSMDMLTVDLADQPDAKPGDPVILWGEGLAVEEIALCSDTIPYTLLCGITQRVQIVEQPLLKG